MDKLKALYDSYIQQGILSSQTTFEQFSSADTATQENLYKQGVDNKILSSQTDINTFQSAWGEVKKKDESVSIVQEDVTESIIPEVQEEVISSDASYQRDDSIADNDYLVGLSNGSIKTNEGNVATISEVIAAATEQGYSQDEIDSLMVGSSSDPTDSMDVSEVQEVVKPNWQTQIDELGESASVWNDPSAEGVSTEEIREYYLSTQQPESVPTDSTLTEQEDIVSSDTTIATDSPTDIVDETIVEQAPIPTELDQQIYQGIYGRAIEQGDTSVPTIEEWLTNEGISGASTEDANKEALGLISTLAKNVEHAYDESFLGDVIRSVGASANPALQQMNLSKKIAKISSDENLTDKEKKEKIDGLSVFDAVYASEPLINITDYTPEETNEFAVGIMSTLLDFAATPTKGVVSGIARVAGKVLPSKTFLGIGKTTYDALRGLGLGEQPAINIIKKQLPQFAKRLDAAGTQFGVFDVAKDFQQQVDQYGGINEVDFTQSPEAFAKGYGLGAGLGLVGELGRVIPKLGTALKTEGATAVKQKGITEVLADRGLSNSRIIGTAGETIGLGGEAVTFGLINATTPTEANPEGELTAESFKEGVGEAFKYIFAFRGVGLAKKIAAGQSVFNKQYSEFNKAEKEKAWSLMTEINKKIESGEISPKKAQEYLDGVILRGEAPITLIEKVVQEISGMKSNITRDQLFNKVFDIKAQAKTDGSYEVNTFSKDGLWLGSLEVAGPAEVSQFMEAFKKERALQINKTANGEGNYPLSNRVNYSINPQPLLESPTTTVDGDDIATTTETAQEPADNTKEVKTIKELGEENKSTYPKVKTDNVFLNEKETLSREERKGVDEVIENEKVSELPSESISIEKIVPTQTNLTIKNLEETKDLDGVSVEESILVKEKDGKFYVVDGHHRLANDILKGNTNVEVKVYRDTETTQESDVSPEVQAEVAAMEADERIDLSELNALYPKATTESVNFNIERIEEFYDGEIEDIKEEITLEQGNTKEGIAEIKSKIADVRKDKSLSKDDKIEAIEDLKGELEDFKQEQKDIISTYKDDIRVVKAEMKADIKEEKKSTPEFRLKSADETQVDAVESAKVTDVINEIESPNKEVQLAFQSSSPISVDGLNKRTDTPLKSTTLKVVDGIPTIFSITDQLTTGNTVNPETGNTIDNLKGAIGFNGTKGHENFAWANLGVSEGNAIISKATKVFEDNKSIFEKWWKENPEYNGLVPMNVVKMGESAMISNEATFRVLADNISTLPSKNRKAALPILKREIKSEIKKLSSIKNPTSGNKKVLGLYRRIQSEISNTKATSIEQVLSSEVINKLPLPARALLINKIAYGSVGEPGLKIKTPGTPSKLVTKALLEGQPKESRRKVNLGVITDVITDPELRNVPIGNIVSLVGVDVLNPQVLKTTHPNYKYGVKGKSIGVLENPVPMEKAYPKTYEKSFKVLIDKESKGKKASGPSVIAQQSGVGIGIPSLDYVGALTSSNSENVNKLVSFLNESFPSVTLSVNSKEFNDIMNTEGVKKYLKGDEVVYGVTVNGDVYVNPEVHNSESALFNTAIHEMGHVWTDYLQTTKKGREMYAKGVELVKETDTYKEQLDIFNGDEAKAANEALAILIGNKGETITDGAIKSNFKEWLLGLWNYIKKQFKNFKDLTSKEIQDLTLDQFLGTALRDILSGKPIKLTPKQRAAMKADVAFRKTSPSNKNAVEKAVKKLRDAGYSEVGIKELLDKQGVEANLITESMAKVKKAPVKPKQKKEEKKTYDPQPYINEARKAKFSDRRMMDYLVRRKGMTAKDARELLDVNIDLLNKLPKSFGNISGGARVGLKLFNKVQDFRDKLIAKNNKLKKNKISEGEIMDKTIEFLESQPEYKAEAETYKVKGEIKTRKDLSTIQAQMITEFQKMNILRPTQAMRAKLETARRDIKQRAKGARDLKATQAILKSFIRKTIPASQYSKAEVVKLINAVSRADKASIDNLINEVFEFAVSKNVKTLQGNITDILKIKTEEIYGGRLKGIKVDSETAKLIDLVNKNILTEKSTATQIEEANEIERQKIEALSESPIENMSEIMARTSLIGINNSLLMENNDPSKVDALDTALENLDAVVSKGKSELARLLEAQKNEYNRQFEIAFKEITGKDIDMSDPDVGNTLKKLSRDVDTKMNKEDAKNALIKITKSILESPTNFLYRAEAMVGLMDAISKTPGEIFGGELQELVTFKIDASNRTLKQRNLINRAVIEDKLKEIYGKKWKNSVRDNRSKKFEIESIDGRSYTQDELYYFYNQFKDPANHPTFGEMWGSEKINKNGSTEEKKRKNSINIAEAKIVIAEMESKLTPEVKEFADWQVDEYFPSLYEYYNEVYKKIYRTDMPWNEFYAGRLHRDGPAAEPINLIGQGNTNQTSVGGSSSKSRIENKNKILKTNGTDALISYLSDMEFFAAYAESVRDIHKIFTNPTIKDAIVSDYGESIYNIIIKRIEIVASQGVKSDADTKLIDYFNNVFVTTRVAVSPVIFVKQMTSAISYTADIGLVNYTKHAAKNMGEMKKIFNEIKDNSVYMQDRGATDISRVLASYSDSVTKEFIPSGTKEFFIDAMMFFVKSGDAGAIYLGGMPLYSYHKAEFKKKNPKATEQEAIDYAILRFERSTKNTQQSSDIQDKDTYQLKGAITRSMSAFQTSQKQYLRKEIMAIRNLYRKAKARDKNAGKGTINENIRTIAMFHIILPMFFQWVTSGFPGFASDWDDDDDQDMLRAMLIGNLNSLFIAGEIIQGLGDFFTDKPYATDIGKSVGMIEMAISIGKKIDIYDKTKDPEIKAAKEKALYADLLTLLKIPAPQLLRMGKNIDKISSENMDSGELILRLLNYSEYVIKNKKKKSKKKPEITKSEMKKFFPDMYDVMYDSEFNAEMKSEKDFEKQMMEELNL